VRLVALALLALALTGFQSGGGRQRGGTCPPNRDWASKLVLQPDTIRCCAASAPGTSLCASGSTYKRFTRAELAALPSDRIIVLGNEEGQITETNPVVPPINSTCFGLDVTGGVMSGDNEKLYIDDLKSNGLQASIVRTVRADLIYRNVAASPDFPASGVLRMPTGRYAAFRSWVQAGASRPADASRCASGCDLSDCRSVPTVYTASAVTGTPLDGCDLTENAYTLKTILEAKEAGLGTDFGFYFFMRGGASQAMFAPITAMADLTDDDYIAWYVDYLYNEVIVNLGYDGISLGNKWHMYFDTSAGRVKFFPDVGDGEGGYTNVGSNPVCTGTFTSTGDTLAEVMTCDAMHSGPLRTASGGIFEYPQDTLGMAKLARALNNHVPPIPYLFFTSANQYRNCTPGATIDADYTVPGCSDIWDDDTSIANENAFIREVNQRATWLALDLQGSDPLGSVGAGSPGSGLTLAELTAMIEGGLHNPTVIPHDSTKGFAAPAVLCSNPSAVNPGTPLTP
jgi:hypothetical protein